LVSAVPPPLKTRVFPAPVLDPVKPLIDAMLRSDLDASGSVACRWTRSATTT
jgi:hypothetical protein